MQQALGDAGLGFGDGALQSLGKLLLMLLRPVRGLLKGFNQADCLLHGRGRLRPLRPIQAGELTLQALLGAGRGSLLFPKALQRLRVGGPFLNLRRRRGLYPDVGPALLGVRQFLVLMADPFKDGVLGGGRLRLVGLGEPFLG